MDRAWLDELISALGVRYKIGAPIGSGVELLYRAGKTEFRPSRFLIGAGGSERALELTVDIRIPKDAPPAQVDALITTFELRTAKPRGFTKVEETSVAMTSDGGQDSGSVRSIRYRHDPVSAVETAKQIRAIVETIDIPIITGIHEPEHVVAREAPVHVERVKHAIEEMENWEYQLDGGLLGSLTVVVNPNDRTLRVVQRKMFSKKELVDTLKLAHVAKFRIVRKGSETSLVAAKKDGSEVTLATGSGNESFVATAGRMAKKVMIPLEG